MTPITRRMPEADSGFAMIFTVLLTVIILASSIAVAGFLVHQVNPSLLSKKNVRTVDAASAGLQAALGQLRNSSSSGSGDLTKLPCSDTSDAGGVAIQVGNPTQTVTVSGDEIDGTVANDGVSTDTATYRADIVYFATDPTSHEGDSSTSWWSNNAIPCKAGLVKSVPSYAFIQSFGQGAKLPDISNASTGNRTQHAIYQFQASNGNTVGGRMAEYYSSASGGQPVMCMDAGSSTPVAGAIPVMKPCQALGTPSQTWQYRSDLTVFYGGDTTLNLCIQNMSGTPRLETCSTPGPPDPTSAQDATYPFASTTQQDQEWAFNDNGHLAAPKSPFTGTTGGDVEESNLGGLCLLPGTTDPNTQAASNAAVLISACDASTTGLTAWNPDPQAGAGKSGTNVSGFPGSPTNQFVNYAEFGRCLDITGQSVVADHLIDYPCKQAPNSCLLTWNQVWYYTANAATPGYGTMSVKYNSTYTRKACDSTTYTSYCLTAPSTGNYITVSPCQATPPDSQLWNATGNIVGNYPNSYLLISKLNGLCMAADPSIQPTFGSSTIVTTACDGSGVPSAAGATANPLLLKWNAPANNPTPGLRDVQEDGGSVNH
jgi:Tfp pilus assembly protein PilX